MNAWQERFAKKVETVRLASIDRFEHVAKDVINDVFAEFQEFMAQQGVHTSAPMSKKGLRTLKFSISENTYVLLTFRMAGIEHCDAQCEFFVPGHEKISPISERIELGSADPKAIRRVFEESLDGLMDAYVESLQSRDIIQDEPVAAGRK